ncbi:MAG: DUF2914 domain-containing protein [Gammaproteobacteria bacterium]|nr:DUF2914 domain-containing protein [Gammaproteobacteria bacterium]
MKISRIIFAVTLLVCAFSASAEDGVARAIFTTGIESKEPVDELGQLTTDHSRIYFFTEIRGMEGHTVVHRWEQGGEVRAEVSFAVAGNRWRVWSSKNLHSSWLGEWTVSVVDEGGNVLAQESFAYVPAEPVVPEDGAPMAPTAPEIESQ